MFWTLLNNLFWLLDADDGAGSGGDPKPGDSTPGQNSGDQDDPPQRDEKREIPKDWKAMSAADFADRLGKASRQTLRTMLKAAGFADAELDSEEKLTAAQEKLVAMAEAARQHDRDKLTAEEKVKADLEAAQTTAREATTAREKAEQERNAAQVQLREFILRSTISAAANGAAHPSDVYDLYARSYAQDKLAEVIKADVDLFTEDGVFNPDAINQDAVKAIIEKCREERREWWQGGYRPPGSPSNSGAQPPNVDLSKLEEQRQMAKQAIRRA